MKTIFVSLIVAVSLFSGASLPSARASNCPAEGFVQDAASAFSSAARRGSPEAFAIAAARFADLRGLALFALGPYRQDLPPAMERKYVNLARSFMGRFMAQNASSLSGGQLTITSCSGNMVSARFGSGTVIFRLSGAYRIEDVTVSGISIAQALRNRFTGVIRNNDGDINALMSYLAK